MRQFFDAKRRYRDCLIFFRMGDFYEMFFDDAVTAARALELTLTSRSKDASGTAIPMCGVPFHAADGYIARLVTKGFRVAICEQVEDPKKAKGVVRREVVRVVSPGTLTDASYLDAREPAFLAALCPLEGPGPMRGAPPDRVGVALVDVSTGDFSVAEYVGESGRLALREELGVLQPREIVVPEDVAIDGLVDPVGLSARVTRIEPWHYAIESCTRLLTEQLQTQSLQGYGLDGHPLATSAAGALVAYLRETQHADLAHIRHLRLRERGDALLVDAMTLKHLEVLESSEGTREGSLLGVLDRTQTSMGARLLRTWLLQPLVALERIQDRLDAVEELAFRVADRGKIRDTLAHVHDVERLVARIALSTATPRDLVALRQSLSVVPRIKALLSDLHAPLLSSLAAEADDLADVRDTIAATLVDEPPAQARDGGAIRDGVDAELDDLRAISRSGKDTIAALEESERARTGIGSLKVRFNRVFGYYIEVSKANLHAVPADYQRKQTIAGGERFVTPALKEYEEKVLGADERILELEIARFESLRRTIGQEAPRIQDTARLLAQLDVLASLADVAALQNYTKPHLHDGDDLSLVEARHPVVETLSRDPFVPNDVVLNGSTHQLVLLTGPNMGGKSTFLRQTALTLLLAQIGSFVPAKQAKLPIVDRIFARVGASDNIARGQSTFMVEMQETARILHTATARSFVVLDEIGRGTATFDGLSIAWAVAEYLASPVSARPKTIFATHYHELTDLAEALPGVVNYHVVVREWKDDIVFLRKVVPGRSDRSYGIQVARLAGLPESVVQRARAILSALEADELSRGGRPAVSLSASPAQQQLALFQSASTAAERLVERLHALEPDRLTPLEALTLIAELKREAES
ncbi:MAG: DNA mismatch repair protein MutS [Vicinamibacterales bacterium]